ncbi:hypothetical protein ACFQ60_07215 [Streptomyces zhihengii]
MGNGPGYVFRLTGLGPVSWSFATADEHLANMANPHSCGQVVPAWRDALILDDPHGRAGSSSTTPAGGRGTCSIPHPRSGRRRPCTATRRRS